MIKNIGTVQYGKTIRYGAMTYNGQGEVAGAVVMMMKGETQTKSLKSKNKNRRNPKTLPEGVKIDAFLDRTKMVNNAIGTVEKTFLEGALIVVFIWYYSSEICVLDFGCFCYSALHAFAIIMMNIFGVSGNLMSLGALDFGLIVDGAVIIVEAVLHRLQHLKVYQNQNISQTMMDDEVYTSSTK